MAKEKVSSSAVVLRTSALQGAANGFIQSSMLTGLSPSGNDALLVKEIVIEFPSALAAAAAAIVEFDGTLTRASKAAVPNLLDDDLVYKYKYAAPVNATSTFIEPGVIRYNPPLDLVIIEDTVYFQFDTNNLAVLGTAYINIICQPATVTESEKVGLLLTRLS